MFDVRESDPLELSEKATLPVMYGIISQETCRILWLNTTLVRRVQPIYQLLICAVGALFARLHKIFSLVNLLHSPCFSAGRDFLCSEDFMFGDDKEKWAVNELVRKSEELKRLPRKDDFDDATRSRIKAFLGPWPRALEKAGLKTPGEKRKK